MELIDFENFIFFGPDPFKLLLYGSFFFFFLATLILFYHWWKYRGDGLLIPVAATVYLVGAGFLALTVLTAYSVFSSL